MTVVPFRRPFVALPMHRALTAWIESAGHPIDDDQCEAFVAGYRLEQHPLVRAYLAGELARMLEGPDAPWTEARRRAFPEAGAPMELDRE